MRIGPLLAFCSRRCLDDHTLFRGVLVSFGFDAKVKVVFIFLPVQGFRKLGMMLYNLKNGQAFIGPAGF